MCVKKKKKDPTLCTIDGCENKRSSKLYCQSHFRRFKLYGDPLALKNHPQSGPCSVSGCKNNAIKKGLCDKHYFRLQKHGDTSICLLEKGLSLKKRIMKYIEVDGVNGCWEWTGFIDKSGYGRIKIGGVSERAHRASYVCFVGDIPEDRMILHKCDNRSCCNPKHLYAGTPEDNVFDMMERGRWAKEKKGVTKLLSKEEIISIVGLLDFGTNEQIAKKFGVKSYIISNIRSGKTYSSVVGVLPESLQTMRRKSATIKKDQSCENNPSASLSNQEVFKIRSLYGKGWEIRNIANKFGIGRTTVKRIAEFETWRNLSVDPDKESVVLHNKRVDSLVKKRKKKASIRKKEESQRKLDNMKTRKEIGSSHLIESEVIKIKKLLAKGEHTNAEIGEKFGVSGWAISRIKCGKNWKHVEI